MTHAKMTVSKRPEGALSRVGTGNKMKIEIVLSVSRYVGVKPLEYLKNGFEFRFTGKWVNSPQNLSELIIWRPKLKGI